MLDEFPIQLLKLSFMNRARLSRSKFGGITSGGYSHLTGKTIKPVDHLNDRLNGPP